MEQGYPPYGKLWEMRSDEENQKYIRSFQRAGEALQLLNPGKEKRYQRSQTLFDYLTHPEKEVTDPDLEDDITALRERIPVLKAGALQGFKQAAQRAGSRCISRRKDCLQGFYGSRRQDG